MTHQTDYTFANELAEKGLEAVPEMMRELINQAMQVERSRYLHAEEYERTKDRMGHANGFALHAFGKTKDRSNPYGRDYFCSSASQRRRILSIPLGKKGLEVNEH